MNPPRNGLHVLDRRVYHGPSVWGYRPMIRFVLDLGELEHHPTSELPGFPDRLLERLPGLRRHGCSYGTDGGFVRRMREGTWLGHVIEHVAIELQNLVGADVSHGKTRGVRGRPGVYDVVYDYEEERAGLAAGRLAVRLVDHLLPPGSRGARGLDLLVPDGEVPPEDEPFDFDAAYEAFARRAERWAFGPSTRALVDAARARGIPVRRLDGESFVQLGHGRLARRVRAGVTDGTSALALEAAGRKPLANRLLDDAGLPVPRLVEVASADAAVAAAREIDGPVALKPAEGNHGRGVSLDLRTEDEVRRAYEEAARHESVAVVEEHLPGHDHRILVVDGRVVAASRRAAAHVVGDGRRTVEELVDLANRDPRRGDGHDRPLTRIVLDDASDRILARDGRTRATVPAEGERVPLRAAANLSSGGTAVDVTDEVHPDVGAAAVRAARAIGLDVAGVDVVAPDLRRPLAESGGGIVEVNAGPGLRMHLAPTEGRPRDVAGPILDMLFPGGSRGRIPLLAITGTNGKTTTARMVSRIFETAGRTVGLTTTNGIFVGGREVVGGDTTGPWSARVVLDDPTVDVAVLETARGGILRAGLAFDRATVGAVLGVQADHLGLNGIDTLDELAWVKSLVAEVVDPAGAAVLNADDPRTLAMADRTRGRIVMVSMAGLDAGPERLREHVRNGGAAVVRRASPRGDLVALHERGRYRPVMWTAEIPATLDGAATVNVQNALAAVAVAWSAGLDVDAIAAGLRGFEATFEQNPGRLNLYEGHPFRALLDYGHNADGLAAMEGLVRHLKGGGRAIGVVAMVPDRRDEDAVELGRVAARVFDRVVVREDADLRGRERGRIADRLERGLRDAGMPPAAIDVVLPETEALRTAMRLAAPGDLVVHFAEDIETAWRTIRAFRPSVAPPAALQGHGVSETP